MVEEKPLSVRKGGETRAGVDDETLASPGGGAGDRPCYLGPYRILRRIGKGGMGEVYRGHDSRLGRDVAIKVLPRALESTPDRLSRFEKEARALAALKHPNIVTIYSVEESEGTSFFTMELVEGSSLAALLPADGLDLERFFELAIPLVDAIGAAHRQGITHRDIKPANVMVDADDRLKVLDFGLTKLVEAEGLDRSEASTALGEPTEIGQVMGTVPYMSPEQAKGLPVDHRSDIFSLGIVLYEMLAGQRPFRGDTKAEMISSILRDDPPPLAPRRQALPERLVRMVGRCLDKSRERRYQSAIDARNDLEELRREHESEAPVGLIPLRPTLSRRAVAWMAAPVAVLAVALLIFWLDTRRLVPDTATSSESSTAERGAPPIYEHRQLTFDGTSSLPRISGDGELVALRSREQPDAVSLIRVHDLRTDQALEITERRGLGTMRWSPDDSHLLFVWRDPEWLAAIVPRFGGEEKALTGVSAYAAWSPTGDLLVHASQASKGLTLLDLATQRDTFLPLEAEFEWIWDLDWSFETDRIAILADTGEGKDERIVLIVDPEQGVESILASSGTLEHMRWGPTGQSLYFLDSRELMSSKVPAEPPEGTLSLQRVMPGIPVVSFSLSRDGARIAYARPTSKANLWALDLATEGNSPRQLTRGTLHDISPALSPNGRHVAFTRRKGGAARIMVLDLESNEAREVTALPGDHDFARWSPDGERLAFFSTHDGPRQLWSISAQGGRARRLHDGGSVNGDFDWSPDGLHLAYVASDARTLVLVDSTSGEVLDSTVAPSGWIFAPRFAPDGTRLAVQLHYGSGLHSFWTYRLDGDEKGWHWGFGSRPPAQRSPSPEVVDLEDADLLRWTADGEGLVFLRENGLYRAWLNTPGLELITKIPSEHSTRADLSEDGRVLVYSETVTSSDVWVAERPSNER